MAEKKLSVKDAVNEINNNTKHFGTKMPSDGNLEKEMDEKGLTYSQMIMGSLASLVWGKLSIKGDDQVKSLLSSPNNIYILVDSIKKNISYIKKSGVKTSLTNKSIETLKTNISNPIVTAIENLPNRFEELIKNSSKSSVETSAVKPLTVDKNAESFIDALTKFVKISNGTKFDELNKILNSDEFKKFIANIKQIGNELSDPKIINSINLLHNFIEAIINIGSIEAASLIKSEYILSYISGKYFNKLKRVLDRVNELNEYSNKISINDKLIALHGIIELIPNIGALHLKDLLWSRISMNYLEYFVKDKITFILDTLETTLKKYSNLDESTEKLSKCIHSILDIFNLDSKKIEDDKEVLSLISSLISNELNNIVNIIKKYDNRTLESVIKKINNINGLITNINSLQNSLPSIISILKSSLKISLIQEEFDQINSILNPNEFKYKINIFKAKKNQFNNIFKNLKLFYDLVVLLNSINNNLDNINVKNTIKVLFNIKQELFVVNYLFKTLSNLHKNSKIPLTFEGLNTTFSNFSDILDSLILYDDTLDKISAIASTVDAFVMLMQHLDTKLLNSKDTAELNVVFTDIANIINNHFAQGTQLNQALRSLSNIDIKNDTYDKIEMISKVIKEIALLSNLKLLSKVSTTSLDPIINITDKLVVVIEKFKTIKEDDIKKADNILTGIMKLVIGTSAILIFGSLIMSYIDPISFLSFTLALGTFVGGILWIYSKISKDQLESAFSSAEDLGLLIALSGAVLVMGSLFIKHINIEELFGFTITLGLFIVSMLYVYAHFNEELKETFSSAFEFGLLIAISGATLIFGSLLFHLINWEDLVGFSITLGIFMFGMVAIYALFDKFFKNAMTGAKDFSILLATSAGLMILGGLIGNWVIENWDTILLFGVNLMLFTILIGAPWIVGSMIFKNALQGAKEFAIIITVSAMLMILGPLLLEAAHNGDYTTAFIKTLGFAFLLSAFVIGVGFALYLANKNSKSSVAGALALSLAVGISAAALVLGPWIINKYINNDWELVLGFAVGLGVYIFAMTYLLEYAGKKLRDIFRGGLAVAIIGVLTYGAAWVLVEFYNSVKRVQFSALLKGIAKMGVVFGAFTALIGGLGVLVSGPQAVILGAGAAALAVLEGLVWGAAKVINAIAIAMKNLDSSAKLFAEKDEKGNPKNVQNILEMINAFGNILKLLTDKISLKTAGKLTAIMPGVMLGIASLSRIGNVVKDWANMWVPDIDPQTGKTKGYRKLDNTDITNAAKNIKAVLEAIGTAVTTVINDPNNKDIFGEGFFSGKSPFEVAMKSFKYSGDILSGIAKGIKDWSSMAIPSEFDPKTGKPIKYTTLNDENITIAQDNIKKVLVGIGSAIKEVVGDPNNTKIFAYGPNSPAMIAAKSIKETSSALTDIVNIIKTFSSNDFKTIIDNFNNEKNGPISNIKKIITGVVDILKIFLEPIKDSRGTIAKWFVGEKTFAENLNDNKDEIAKSVNSIDTFCKSITQIFTLISNLNKSIQGHKNNIESILDENNVINKIGDVLKVFDTFASDITYKNMNNIYSVSRNAKTYTNNINETYNVINNIVNKLLRLYSLNNKINNISFINISQSIIKLNTALSNINTSLNNTLYYNVFESLNKFILIFSNINLALNSIDLFNLSNSINKFIIPLLSINSSLESINFANITNSLNKFIEFIKAVSNINASLNMMSFNFEYGSFTTNLTSNINDNKNEINKSINSIDTFCKSITQIFTLISNLNNALKNNKEAIDSIINKDSIINHIGEILQQFNKIIFDISLNTINMSYVIKNSKIIANNVNVGYQIINTILNKLLLVSSLNNKINNISFDNISESITKFTTTLSNINSNLENVVLNNNLISVIEKLVENTNQLIGLLNNFVELIKLSKAVNSESYDDLKNGILSLYNTVSSIKIDTTTFLNYSSFTNLLEDYIKTINSLGTISIFDNNVNSLKDGILNINSIIKQIDDNKTFAQHVETLKKYIETINCIQLDKLNRMQNFVDAINQLSMRLGNLDNLTDAIANRLSAVLYELVNQLTKADASINNAHQLQEKRKKLIEESVSKIENLMSQHMIVEISQVTQNDFENNNTSYSQGGNINNKEVDGNTPSGTEYDKSSNDNRLSSPEESEVQNQKQQNMPNVLTKEEFDNAMRDKWVKAIAKAVKS